MLVHQRVSYEILNSHKIRQDPELENNSPDAVEPISMPQRMQNIHMLPSGNNWHSYWKWPFIVDVPIKNGDFP